MPACWCVKQIGVYKVPKKAVKSETATTNVTRLDLRYTQKKPVIVVSIKSGLVEGVYSTVPSDVVILDWDTECGNHDLIFESPDGDRYEVAVENFPSTPVSSADDRVFYGLLASGLFELAASSKKDKSG